MLRAYSILLGLLVAVGSATAQELTDSTATLPQRDLQATTLASQAYQAMVGLTQLQDATLQATVTWTAGDDEELGTGTLQVRGGQESRMVLYLTSGQRQEVRNQQSGAWAGSDGTWHATSLHNCWTDGGWFFPTFFLQTALNDPTVSLTYAGLDNLEGTTVAHLIVSRVVPSKSARTTSFIQSLSTMDVYLDPSSSLPMAIGFNVHPDNNANLDIPAQVRFSDYQAINGIQVPTHIQKFLQGGLLLDLKVTKVAINSGLTDSDFAVPYIAPPDSSAETGGVQ